MMRGIRPLPSATLIAVAAVLAVVAQLRANEPATRPFDKRAATQPAPLDPTAALLMQALGDPDPQVRSRAGDQLLTMGQTALVALGRAARSDDPEARYRARGLLQKIQWADPDDPPVVGQLLENFGALSIEERRQVVRQLAAINGSDVKAAWRALGRILLNDPADDVLWEVVAQARMHPQEQQSLGIGPQSRDTITGPMMVLAARIYVHRNPQLAINLYLRALAADKNADPPVSNRTEILFVVRDLLKLARDDHHELEAARLIREQYPLAAPNQRPWLNRELYSLHANAGPLSGFGEDLILRFPDLSDRPTLYAIAQIQRRLGFTFGAAAVDDIAFACPRWKPGTHGPELLSQQLTSRVDVADYAIQHGWLDAGERELREVLLLASADDATHRVGAYFLLMRIATARGDDFERAECIRNALELFEKYPNPALRLGSDSTRLLPDDMENLRATMHWSYFRAARKARDVPAGLEHGLALASLAPISDSLVLDVYPFLVAAGHEIEAQQLFDANYEGLKAAIAQVGQEARGLSRLAWMCARCDQHLGEAQELAHDALAQEPDNPRFINVLAEAEFRRGHAQEAVRLQTRALGLAPKDATLAANLARYEAGAK